MINPPMPAPAPAPAVPPPASQLRLFSLIGALLVFVLMAVLMIAVIITGHPSDGLNNPRIQEVLGFGVTLTLGMLGFAGIGGAIQDIHLSLNSRLDQLVASTATSSFQQGVTHAETAAAAAAQVAPTPPNVPSA